MDEQLEALFADLFAERIASSDTTDSEQIIIEDLKRYLRHRNYDNDNINLLLFQFYQYYGINVSYEEISNVSNNNIHFYIRHNYNLHDNQEPNNNELDNNESDNNELNNQEPDNNELDNQEPDNNELNNQESNNQEPMFNYIYRNIINNYQNLNNNNNLDNNNDNLDNNNNDNNGNNNLDNNDNNNNNNNNNNNLNNNNRIIYINNNFLNRINNFIRYNNYNINNNEEYNDIEVPRLNPGLLIQAINIILPPQNPAILEPVKIALDDECLEQLSEKVLEEKIEGMCMICFDEFNIDQTVLELPCDHLYHKDCIVPYLKEHSNKCPICRSEVGKSKPLL